MDRSPRLRAASGRGSLGALHAACVAACVIRHAGVYPVWLLDFCRCSNQKCCAAPRELCANAPSYNARVNTSRDCCVHASSDRTHDATLARLRRWRGCRRRREVSKVGACSSPRHARSNGAAVAGPASGGGSAVPTSLHPGPHGRLPCRGGEVASASERPQAMCRRLRPAASPAKTRTNAEIRGSATTTRSGRPGTISRYCSHAPHCFRWSKRLPKPAFTGGTHMLVHFLAGGSTKIPAIRPRRGCCWRRSETWC